MKLFIHLKPLLLYRSAISIVYFFCTSITGYAQIAHTPPILITGKVLSSKDHTPLVGATLILENSQASFITGDDGNFTVRLAINEDTLIIRHLGYQTKQITVNENTNNPLIITLEEAATQLGEVVVSTGYQNIPKERATGSFDFINNKLLNRSVSTDILSRLKGITSGLLFDPSSAAYGNPLGVSIRGRSTIFANTNPLIILDNFPYDGDINNINPNDVESITILKDAAASSIWGARSGNGVIVINTKKGRYNQPPKVSFNSNITFTGKPDLFYSQNMSSRDYIDVEEMLFNKGYYDSRIGSSYMALSPVVEILLKEKNGQISSANADAQINVLKQHDDRNDFSSYLYRKAVNQQYAINISGGGQNQLYYVSVGYDRDMNNLIGNKNDRLTLNANNTYSLIHHKLEVTTGILYTQANTQSNGIDPSTVSYGNYNSLYPYAQLADAKGNSLSIAKYRQNFIDTAGSGKFLDWNYRPLDELKFADNKTNSTNYQANLGIEYKVLSGLDINIKYQYEKGVSENKNLHTLQSYYTRNYINQFSEIDWGSGQVTYPVPYGGIIDFNNTGYTSQNLRGQINYENSWSLHRLSIIGGMEVKDLSQDLSSDREYGYDDQHGTNIPVDYVGLYQNYATGFSNLIQNGFYSRELTDRYVSLFANAAYSYKDRYTLSASARRDASNLFGVASNQKWVPLWSVGGSWDISKEPFFQANWCSYLKLRATYGYNGNIDKTVAADLVTLSIGSNVYGNIFSIVQNAPNPDLRWEKVGTANFGLDYSVVNDRISGSIEYYRKKGMDLIGYSALAPSTGLTQYKGNTADMKAHGYDIIINSKNIVRRFQWNTTILFSYTKNWITSYKATPAPISAYVENPVGINPIVGKPVSSLYSYRWAGLDPQTGDPMGLLDGKISKNYGSITNSTSLDDMVYGGRTDPPFFGSIRNTFTYKRFSLSLLISYKLGYYFRIPSINYSNLFSGSSVGHSDFSKRWQQPGDEKITNVPSLIYPSNPVRDEFYTYSNILVNRADNIRLQDIQFSYDLNKSQSKRLPFQNIRLYLYVSNVGIIWKANKQGIDPDYIPNPGYYYSLPPAKSFAFGINIDF